MKLEHFTPEEFRCRCGCGAGFADMDPKLLRMLEHARGIANLPFHITSAVRCERHNARVGGKPESAHLTGHAVDIHCAESRSRYEITLALFAAGFNRIGIGKEFIHIDIDPNKPGNVCWVY